MTRVFRSTALAAVASLLLPVCASAQTITTESVTPVPVAGPWMLLALWVTLIAGGVWLLRGQGRRHHASALLLAGLAATGLWSSVHLRAQVSMQFTNPAGETLAIPVTQIVQGGALQGFERVDYLNASNASLRILTIDPPDFDACFPGGLDAPLPAPSSSAGSPCAAGTILESGDSCRVDVDAICRELEADAIALIDVAPTSVTFPENTTVVVTVSTEAGSPVPARNVAAAIPGGSGISVVSSTCPASLAPGASCNIGFTSAIQELATVSIAGDNTAAETVSVTVVAAPLIAITGPVQSSRVVAVGGLALDLTITNNAGSQVNAVAITVVNKAAVPDLAVDASDCASVAPGASCTLELTSATPYAPGTITIGGGNTGNSPTTLVAFSHLGGLVFEESGGAGKVVIDVAQEFSSQWSSGLSTVVGAASLDDGAANTDAIVANAACSGDTANCAAQQCRNISADWYLPARNELSAVVSALCSNGAIPCNAGGFSSTNYWSSTQFDILEAWLVVFPNGLTAVLNKAASLAVRCVRAF